MQLDSTYMSIVLVLGFSQRNIKTGYTSEMFQEWEHLSKVIRQGMHQHCLKIGNGSAMS